MIPKSVEVLTGATGRLVGYRDAKVDESKMKDWMEMGICFLLFLLSLLG